MLLLSAIDKVFVRAVIEASYDALWGYIKKLKLRIVSELRSKICSNSHICANSVCAPFVRHRSPNISVRD